MSELSAKLWWLIHHGSIQKDGRDRWTVFFLLLHDFGSSPWLAVYIAMMYNGAKLLLKMPFSNFKRCYFLDFLFHCVQFSHRIESKLFQCYVTIHLLESRNYTSLSFWERSTNFSKLVTMNEKSVQYSVLILVIFYSFLIWDTRRKISRKYHLFKLYWYWIRYQISIWHFHKQFGPILVCGGWRWSSVE